MKAQHADTLYELFTNIYPKIEAIEEKLLAKNNVTITLSACRVLAHIEKSKVKNVGEIAKLLCVSPGTLSLSIARLEKDGYLIRTPDAIDRRIVLLSLTKKGKEVVKIYQSIIYNMIENITTNLRLGESSILIRALQDANDYFKQEMEK